MIRISYIVAFTKSRIEGSWTDSRNRAREIAQRGPGGAGAGVAAACCRTLAPSSSPGIPLHPPALRCARRPRGGCPRPAYLLACPQPARTQRSKLPAPPELRRRRAVSGRKSGDRRQGSTWRRAAPVWGRTRAAGPRRGVVCASFCALGWCGLYVAKHLLADPAWRWQWA